MKSIATSFATAALLTGCGSTSYKFETPLAQSGSVEYFQGIPTLYSQGDGSIVAVRPAARTLEEDGELNFHLSVTNAGDRPFDMTTKAVSMHFEQQGEAQMELAYSFDEYTALKQEEKSGAGMAAMGLMAIAGGAISGYSGAAGNPALAAESNEMMSTALLGVEQTEAQNATIDQQLEASDQVYLHRTTVRPGQTHSGLISFGKLDKLEDDVFDIRVSIADDIHSFTFALVAEE